MKLNIKGPKNSTPEEIEEYLYKALKKKRVSHDGKESFNDQVTDELCEMMLEMHAELYEEMINELIEEFKSSVK